MMQPSSAIFKNVRSLRYVTFVRSVPFKPSLEMTVVKVCTANRLFAQTAHYRNEVVLSVPVRTEPSMGTRTLEGRT